MKNRFALSAVCFSVLTLTGPVARAAGSQEADDMLRDRGAERDQQRRAELRQAIASQRANGAVDMPLRTLSDRERAELREQLRRESSGPREGGMSRVRGASGNPGR